MAASGTLLRHFLAASFILFVLTSAFAAQFDIQPTDDDDADADADGGSTSPKASSSLAQIFSRLGFQEMSAMAPFIFDSTSHVKNIGSAWPGPFTVFAPSDSSIDACSSCSLPLLLQEHTVPGLYNFKYLQSMPFGSRIQTLIHSRCLTVTKSDDGVALFVGGVEITHPDLHNDGYFVIHGLDGYVSHLSPLSCDVEKTTSLSFNPTAPEASIHIGEDRSQPQSPANNGDGGDASATTVMRVMLDDATLRLRSSGFSTLALALKIRYEELQRLQSMTIFALNDISIFRVGHGYVQNLGFHIVPNTLLTADVLQSYPTETQIQTMEPGNNLVITSSASDGDALKINYASVKTLELITNLNIVVHEISDAFGHVGFASSVEELRGRIEGSDVLDFKRWDDEYGDYGFEQAPRAVSDDAEVDDYRGL